MKQRLDQMLVERGLVETRARAQALIMSGNVYVDDVRRDKPGWQIKLDATIRIREKPFYVSRAGLKLESANLKLGVDFQGKIVLDVGSSTGGFTDYSLNRGAKKVYAVDVGTHQLHEKLRGDDKVAVMEKTDIREAMLPEQVDIAVVDVSFISLRLVLKPVTKHLKKTGLIIAMCKPQFEAGIKEAARHKGVIKNDTIRRRILKEFELWLKQNGFAIKDKADSGLKGAKGNLERFYLLSYAQRK